MAATKEQQTAAKETKLNPSKEETVSKEEFEQVVSNYNKIVNAFNKLLKEYNDLHIQALLSEEGSNQ